MLWKFRPPQSLFGRLSLLFGLSLSVIFSLHAWLMSSFPRYLTEEYVLFRLEHDGEALLGSLGQYSQNDQLAIGPIAPIYQHPFSGHYFQIHSGQQVLRSRSLWDEVMETHHPLKPGETHSHYLTGPKEQPLLVWAGSFEFRDQLITIAVAEDISHMEVDIAEFRLQYALGIVITLLLILLSQGLILRHSLGPLQQSRRDCRRIANGEIEKLDTQVPSEIRPLVDEINHLLQTLQQRAQRSRQALGNLAHAMKTPLSVLQINLQQQAKHDPKAQENYAHTLRLKQVIERELKRSRLSHNPHPGRRFHVQTELHALTVVLQKLYPSKQLTLLDELPETLKLNTDREDMLELFGNLLDNACRWAKQAITVQLRQIGQQLEVTIQDDGPGVAPETLSQLSQRGLRLDEQEDSHGLGLAIAQDIIEQYSGELRFRNQQQSGLEVVICLPI